MTQYDSAEMLPTGPIAMDHPCIKCGYSLRGLSPSGVCPECGTSIERSLRGDMLAYSDPGYLKQLRMGAQLIMAGILISILLNICTGILARQVPGFLELAPMLNLGTEAMLVFGWWALGTPDAGQMTSNKGEKPRRLVRGAVLLSFLLQVLVTIVTMANIWLGPVTQILGVVAMLAKVVGFYAGMVYLRWLTPRIPNMKAFKRAKTLMVMIAVLIGLYVVLFVVIMAGILRAGAAAAGGGAFMGMAVMGGIVGLAALVTLIMYYNLFSWIRKDIGNILKAQGIT